MSRKLTRKQKLRIRDGILILIGIIIGVLLTRTVYSFKERTVAEKDNNNDIQEELNIDVELLTPNEYSRPQIELAKVKGIVIHYTANPGSTAIDNRNYFEGLMNTGTTHASSHFIVGLDGEIVQCIPTTEQAYASNGRNDDTIAIECCHEDKSGRYNDKTYASLVRLTAFLCKKYNLTEKDIIRHYDVTGKMCPKYYVKHEDKWKDFKKDVKKELE